MIEAEFLKNTLLFFLFFFRRYIYALGIRPATNWPLLGKDIHSGCSNLKIEDNEVLGMIRIYIYTHIISHNYILYILKHIIQCLNRVFAGMIMACPVYYICCSWSIFVRKKITFWMSGLCAGEGSTSASATRGESEGRVGRGKNRTWSFFMGGCAAG